MHRARHPLADSQSLVAAGRGARPRGQHRCSRPPASRPGLASAPPPAAAHCCPRALGEAGECPPPDIHPHPPPPPRPFCAHRGPSLLPTPPRTRPGVDRRRRTATSSTTRRCPCHRCHRYHARARLDRTPGPPSTSPPRQQPHHHPGHRGAPDTVASDPDDAAAPRAACRHPRRAPHAAPTRRGSPAAAQATRHWRAQPARRRRTSREPRRLLSIAFARPRSAHLTRVIQRYGRCCRGRWAMAAPRGGAAGRSQHRRGCSPARSQRAKQVLSCCATRGESLTPNWHPRGAECCEVARGRPQIRAEPRARARPRYRPRPPPRLFRAAAHHHAPAHLRARWIPAGALGARRGCLAEQHCDALVMRCSCGAGRACLLGQRQQRQQR